MLKSKEHLTKAKVVFDFKGTKSHIALLQYEAQKFAALHDGLVRALLDETTKTSSVDFDEEFAVYAHSAQRLADMSASCVDRLRQLVVDLGYRRQ